MFRMYPVLQVESSLLPLSKFGMSMIAQSSSMSLSEFVFVADCLRVD